MSAAEILERLGEASTEELTLVKETAEELLWLRSAGEGDVADINNALAESDTDILAGRLHTSDEIRRSLAL